MTPDQIQNLAVLAITLILSFPVLLFLSGKVSSLSKTSRLIRIIFGRPVKPSEEFTQWCQSLLRTPPKRSNRRKSADYWTQHQKENEGFSRLCDDVLKDLQNNNFTTMDISIALTFDHTFATDICNSQHFISEVNINSAETKQLTLRNLWIGTLNIAGGHGISINLQNCHIVALILHGSNGPSRSTINIVHTNIGLLRLQKYCARKLNVISGSILSINCPQPGDDSPFSGSVIISNDVFFPRNLHDGFIETAQPYHNMRYHLRALEDIRMADIFHVLELRVEETLDDSDANRFFSRIYRYASNYGSSILRPLIWVVLIIALTGGLIYKSDGVVLADKSAPHMGWEKILLDKDYGNLSQASYLALQPLVNPLGIFGNKAAIVKPKNVFIYIIVWFQSLSVYICLVLFVFSLRRRFKIQ